MSHPFSASRRSFPCCSMILALLLVAGCASVPSEQATAPVDDFVPDANYYLLMAEIALQRKAYLVTAREYLNAAQRSTDPELAQRATEFAYEYGYDVFALTAVRRWLALQPDDQLANDYAARLYLRRNQLDPALHHWRVSLGSADLSDDEYLRLGADMAEEDNPAGATTILIQLVNERPDENGLRMALAYAALRSGAHELSLAYARRAEAAGPDWLQPQLVIPKALLSMGREYEAFAYLDAILEAQPSSTLELEYVRLLSAVGRHEDAIRKLIELGKVYGAQPELVRMHGLIAYAAGDLKAAEQDFEQLLAGGNHVYESYFMLGRIALSRDEHGRASSYFGRIRGGGFLVRAQLGISLAYEQMGDDEAALEQLRSFAVDYPRYAFDIVGSEAQLLYRMGRIDEALARYETAVQLRPDQLGLMLEYAALLDIVGRIDEAVAVMERAVEIAPVDADALNVLGYTLTNRTRRHQEAYRLIRLAVEIDPDNAPIMDSMGWVLFRMGRLDEARSYLELALAKLDDPEMIAHLGEVLWVADERAGAVALWDRGLVDYPDSQPLIETRQRFMP